MKRKDLLSRFPPRFRAGTGRPERWYVRLPGHFAVHGEEKQEEKRLAARALAQLEGGRIRLYRGDPDTDVPPDALTPVYSLEPGGTPAVPTGRVFVRFAEGVPAEDRREALGRVGYNLVEVPVYAPQAAWVEAREGGTAASLEGLPRLEALPEVANVEPQMLSEARRR